MGVTDIFWRSREGKNYSALVYHPTSQPASGTKFSVIVYSHGLGASAQDFSYLGQAWASRGVVAIMLRHPESDGSVWRGRVRPMAQLKEAYHRYWHGRDRAMAIRSAIDFVYAAHYDSGPMGADVDLNKIAVAGNDLGALAALLVAGQLPPDNGPSLKDERVSAVVALSPPIYCDEKLGPAVYAGITAPLMVVTGTHDDGIVGSTKAYQRRLPYDSVRYSDRYLVVLIGGDHRSYGRRWAGQQSSSFHDTIGTETGDFLSAYLMNDYSALMAMREYGAASAISNAMIEKTLVPLRIREHESGGVATSAQ
ncbi:MAG: alpha/beta hydrolase family protein [Thermoguttaceae bacterium]